MTLRNYGFAASGQAAQTAIALVGLVAMTRVLGPADYGVFVVLGTILTLASIAASAGPAAAVLVLSARGSASGAASLHGQILIASVALFGLTFVLTIFAVDPITRFLSGTLAPPLVAISLLRLPAQVYATLATGQLSGRGRIGLVAGLNTAAALLGLLGVAGAYIASDPLTGAIVGTAIASFATAALVCFGAMSASGIAWPRGWEPWRRAGTLALPMHVGTLAYWVMLRSDTLAVNALLGSSSAGIYGLALQLSERIGLITAPLYNATAWQVSGPDRRLALQTMLRVARIELAIGVVAAGAALLAGRLVITAVSGPAYAGASLPLAILILGAATLPVWSSVGLYLVSHQAGAWPTAVVQLVVAGAAVAGYWILGSNLGIMGPAAVSTGAYIALVITGVLMVRRRDDIVWRSLVINRTDIADAWRGAQRVRDRLSRAFRTD